MTQLSRAVADLGFSNTMSAGLLSSLPAFTETIDITGIGDTLAASWSAHLSDSTRAAIQDALPSVTYNVTAKILESVDFGFLKAWDIPALRGIPSWLPDLATLHGRLPTDWAGVRVDVDEIEEDVLCILADGIPLAWVPESRVLRLLLDAPDGRARRRVISNNYRSITSSCMDIVTSLPLSRRPLYLADMTAASIRALRDGHVESAQALAADVLETLLNGFSLAAFGRSKSGVVNRSFQEKLAQDRDWRLLLALGPAFTVMKGSHTVHERENAFRRNATAHAVNTHQYSRINATLAIMNATAVLTCFARDTPAFD